MESEIKFPLSHPTHYIACLNNFDVTHVAVKLSRQMLWTMFLVLWIPKIVALLEKLGIGRLTITRPRKSGKKSLFDDLGFYQYVGEDKIQPGDDRECSTDEDPYSCLTLGELASLGGFANEEVLQRQFKPIPQDEASAIGVTVCRTNTGMIFFKVLFEGEEYGTDMFNVRLLIDKYFAVVHETSSKNVKEALRLLNEKWEEHHDKA
jgi:hypothetical protein